MEGVGQVRHFFFCALPRMLRLRSHGTGRIFNRFKKLTGQFVHTLPFNILALFTELDGRKFVRCRVNVAECIEVGTLLFASTRKTDERQQSLYRSKLNLCYTCLGGGQLT